MRPNFKAPALLLFAVLIFFMCAGCATAAHAFKGLSSNVPRHDSDLAKHIRGSKASTSRTALQILSMSHGAKRFREAFYKVPMPANPLRKLPKLSKHRFHALQNTTGCPTNGFVEAYNDASSKCAGIDLNSWELYEKYTSANVSLFCGINTCGAALQYLADTPAFVQCAMAVDQNIQWILERTYGICTSVGGINCLPYKERYTRQCNYDAKTKETCEVHDFCQLETRRNDDEGEYIECYTNETKFWTDHCGDDRAQQCLTRYSAISETLLARNQFEVFLLRTKAFCAVAGDNAPCSTRLEDVFRSYANPFDDLERGRRRDWMLGMCNNNHLYQCAITYLPTIVDAEIDLLKDEYYGCVRAVDFNEGQSWARCREDWYTERLVRLNDVSRFPGLFCARSEQGEWCQDVWDREKSVEGVCGPLLNGQSTTCTAECDAAVKRAKTNLGCCLGSIHALTVKEYDPKFWSPTDQWTFAPFTYNYNNPYVDTFDPNKDAKLFRLGICPSQNGTWNASLKEVCPAPTSIDKVNPCFTPEYFTLQVKMDLYCEDVGERIFDLQGQNETTLRATYDSFCVGGCHNAVEPLLRQDSPYRRCLLTAGDLEGADAILPMCTKNPVDDEWCVMTVKKTLEANACHQKSDESSCNNAAHCSWLPIPRVSSDRITEKRCDLNPDTAFLQQVCNLCLDRVSRSSTNQENPFGAAARELELFACVRAGDTLCYPQTAGIIRRTTFAGLPNETLADVCTNSTQTQCMRKMLGGLATLTNRRGTESYRGCVDQNPGDQANVDSCAKDFVQTLDQRRGFEEMSNTLCRRNAAGTYCHGALTQYINGATFLEPCLQEVQQSPCSASCDAKLKAISDNFGCCAGTIHQTFLSTDNAALEIPVVNGAVTPNVASTPVISLPSSAPVATGEVWLSDIGAAGEGLSFFGKCASVNTTSNTWEQQLHIGCARQRSASIVTPPPLRLPIAYSRLQEDPALERQLLESLVADVALVLGLPIEDIINARLSEDTSNTVVVSSSGHTMRAAAVSNGVRFDFSIQGSNDDETTAAGNALAAARETTGLSLPRVSDVVSGCGCVDSTVSSLDVIGTDLRQLEPAVGAPESGTGSPSVLLVAALTIAAIFFS